MGYEVEGKPITDEDEENGLDWEEYAAYRTIVVADGELLGGLYTYLEEALAAGRRIALGLGNLGRDVDQLTQTELDDLLADDPRVSFSEVGVREVLYA